MSSGVGCRRGSDPTLLWLWGKPAATALIGPLRREPPNAAGAVLKRKKDQKKKKTNKPCLGFNLLGHKLTFLCKCGEKNLNVTILVIVPASAPPLDSIWQ